MPPVKLGPDIDSYSNRGNRCVLASAISSLEQLEFVAEGSRKFGRLGLLAVTDKRLLYVEERALWRPVAMSFPFVDVSAVDAQVGRTTGTIELRLVDGSTRTFRHVWPQGERLSS